MRERVAELVGGVEKRMWVMTFHAACARLLRIEAERLGYKKSFTIYDQSDSLRMVKRCLADLEIDTKRYPPRSVQARISDLKNLLIDAETYAEEAVSPFETMVAQVYRSYEKRLLEANAMDFDDLLMRAVNVLELFEDVRERYQERFRWILVDEYQDTNRAQYQLLKLLGGKHGNLTVVGDDSQAIYSFRGADVRNILEFEKDFPDAAVVKLEQNYRSTQTILSGANSVISQQPVEPRQEPLDRGRRRREDHRRPARRRARGGAVRRRRDRGAGDGRGLRRATRSRSSTGPTR